MSGVVFPPNIKIAVPIFIINTQSIAAPAPFQQMITVKMSNYSAYAAPNLQNIEFFYADGTLIPSWLESGNSNTSQAIYWLLLKNGIGANSSLTVYMGFAATSVNLFDGTTVGEAPQLSPAYGQYDNGSNVFDFYDNFAGTALKSSWSISGSPTITVNNGITMTAPTTWYGIINSKQLNAPSVVEIYGEMTAGFAIEGVGLASTSSAIQSQAGSIAYEGRTASSEGTTIENPIASSTLTTGAALDLNVFYIITGETLSSTEGTVLINYGAAGSATLSSASISVPNNLTVATYNSTIFVQWTRARACPPNGTQPIVLIQQPFTITPSSATLRTFRIQSLEQYGKSLDTFTDAAGNVFTGAIAVEITNNQDTSTPLPFQQMLSLTPPGDANSDWSNVAFTDQYNNEMHSWVEAQGSPSTIWIRLPFGILAHSSSVIYMWVGAPSVTWDSFRGEAPQLSATYGDYDNGADIFPFYDNFAGTSLKTGWINMGKAAEPVVNNGVTLNILVSATNNQGYYYVDYSMPVSSVIDAYMKDTGTGGTKGSGIGIGTAVFGDTPGFRVQQYEISPGAPSVTWAMEGYVAITAATPSYVTGTMIVVSGTYFATGSAQYTNYASVLTGSGVATTGDTYPNFGVFQDQIFVQWLRTRALPPNSVMPAANYVATPVPDTTPPIKITLVNSASSPAPAGLQVLLNINWSNYTSNLAPDIGNVRFYDSSGTEMYGWLESGNSNTATSSNIWLKLNKEIAANSTDYVMMHTLSVAIEYDGVYWGEAPQLSPAYGQYDNGSNVFDFYDNFAGTVLSSKWTTGGNYTGSVNNGLTLTSSASSGGIYASDSFTAGILETDWEQTTAQTYKVIMLNTLAIGTGWYTNGYNSRQLAGQPTTSGNLLEKESGGTNTVLTTGDTQTNLSTYYVMGIEWNGATGILNETLNYASISSATDTTYTSMLGIALMTWQGGTNVIHWVRLRGYPPGNTLPTTLFPVSIPSIAGRYFKTVSDSASNTFDHFFKVYITNSQLITTAKPFQKLLILPYFAGINPDWSNVMFTDSSFCELPSWVEVRGSDLVPSNIWVKMPDGIGASSTVVIYGWVGSASTTWEDYRGEASQLSSSFGAHDNIDKVMNQGLLYQIYYDSTGMIPSIGHLQDAYSAPLTSGYTMPYGPITSSTPPFTTPGITSTQDVNGTTQPYTLFYFDCGYTGGILPPNPPILNETVCGDNAWVLKAIGFVKMPTPSTIFSVFVDDGVQITVGNMESSAPHDEESWLFGMIREIAQVNFWNTVTTQSGNLFSTQPAIATGTYRMVLLYMNNKATEAAIALYTNVDPTYHSPSPLPNGVDPSVAVYSACTTLASPKPIELISVIPSKNPGIPLSSNKENLFLVQNPCPVLL